MAKLEVLKYPEKSLKEPSEPVKEVTEEHRQLFQDMIETMYLSHGLGLAAPQVGLNITLFVMDVARPNPLDEENPISNPLCLINPKIIEKSDETIIYEEGCLSCPDLLVDVKRSKAVVVEALNEKGELITHNFTELEAVCAQHEMDHLQGTLLTDQISRLKRELYRKKRMRLKKEEEESFDSNLL
ncbi:peptide deformylase [bacterium]|nr:peptide deformylase [bacterium]MBU1917754.1 peptide deformylase [bacterium]